MNTEKNSDCDTASEVEVLNHVRQLLCYSLPVYLQFTRPWKRRNMEKVNRLLQQLAADQQEYAQRLAEQIDRSGGVVESGGFPIRFTALHDLSLEYLIHEVLACHRHDVAAIEAAAAQLDPACSSCALVQEIAQSLRKRLEELEAALERNAGGAKPPVDSSTESSPSAESAHATPATG